MDFDLIIEGLRRLADTCGQGWQIAVALTFVAMTFESTDPTPAEEAKRNALQNVVMLAGLATPFLLFIHAFWSVGVAQTGGSPGDVGAVFGGAIASGSLILLLGALVFVMLVPALLGLILRKIAPPLARITTAIAPYLTVAAFVLTVYVTQRSAIDIISLALGRLS